MGFPGGSVVKNLFAIKEIRRHGFDPWIRKIPWRRAWQPTPVFMPGESHGQRSLVGYNPQGGTELDAMKWLSRHASMHTHIHTYKYVWVFIHTYIFAYTYICVYICMLCVYIHISQCFIHSSAFLCYHILHWFCLLLLGLSSVHTKLETIIKEIKAT